MADRHPISIALLDHIVLRANKPAVLIDFYCEALGCTPEKIQDDLGLYQLRAGRSLIDILSVDGPIGGRHAKPPHHDAPTMDHLCLQLITWDEVAIRAHLKDFGINPGKTERHYGASGYGPAIMFEDPEGNTVELKGPPTALSDSN